MSGAGDLYPTGICSPRKWPLGTVIEVHGAWAVHSALLQDFMGQETSAVLQDFRTQMFRGNRESEGQNVVIPQGKVLELVPDSSPGCCS